PSRVGWLQFLHVEINRRPPSGKIGRIAENVGHLAARPLDAPPRQKLVLVTHCGGAIFVPSASRNVMSLYAASWSFTFAQSPTIAITELPDPRSVAVAAFSCSGVTAAIFAPNVSG